MHCAVWADLLIGNFEHAIKNFWGFAMSLDTDQMVGLAGLVAAIAAAIAGTPLITIAGAVTATAATYDALGDWFTTDAAWVILTDKVNQRFAAAGIEIDLPTVNLIKEEGRDTLKKHIEKFMLEKINRKTGADFKAVGDLTQENFLAGVGGVLAAKVNQRTGANLTHLWPVEKLREQLQTEVVRQFDNRGRYAGGAMFRGNTLSLVRNKIAAKHPELMAQVKAVENGGEWGPPRNEKHARRREKGRARQLKYRQTHQQVWAAKGAE